MASSDLWATGNEAHTHTLFLPFQEFRQVMKNQSVRTWLAAQDLHMSSLPEKHRGLFKVARTVGVSSLMSRFKDSPYFGD